MYEDLKEHLSNNILRMKGGWVKKNSNYEDELCEIILMQVEKGRHWDARWGDYYIEIKKGVSIWLDLVRYSELIKEFGMNSDLNLINLFFIPTKDKSSIKEIICVTTQAIINKLNLNSTIAKQLLDISKIVPRSLNAQANLTVNDIKDICEFRFEYE